MVVGATDAERSPERRRERDGRSAQPGASRSPPTRIVRMGTQRARARRTKWHIREVPERSAREEREERGRGRGRRLRPPVPTTKRRPWGSETPRNCTKHRPGFLVVEPNRSAVEGRRRNPLTKKGKAQHDTPGRGVVFRCGFRSALFAHAASRVVVFRPTTPPPALEWDFGHGARRSPI